MHITVNDEEIELQGKTVADLASQMGLQIGGVAIAVGMELVPRDEWNSYELKEGDKVIAIRAAQGG